MGQLYAYQVRDRTGKSRQGVLEAESRDEAAEKLRSEGYYITSLRERKGRKALLSLSLTGGKGRIKFASLMLLCRQLSTMVAAGVPVVAALQLLEGQLPDRRLRASLSRVRRSVSGGTSVAEALREEGVFPRLFVNMVETGEETGNLDVVLQRLADYYENEDRLRKGVKQAMMYPAVVSTIAFVMVLVILFFVLPTFVDMFSGMGVELPLITRIVIMVRDFIVQNFLFLCGGVLALVLAFVYVRSTERGRLVLGRLILKLPIAGGIVSRVAFSRFSRTFGLLLASGIPVVRSLEIVKRVVANAAIERDLEELRSAVEGGGGMATSLKKARTFPPMLRQMIEVGEETGSLDTVLEHVAAYYDREVDNTVKNLTSLIEPVIMAVLALVVLVIALSVVLPMFQMTTSMM